MLSCGKYNMSCEYANYRGECSKTVCTKVRTVELSNEGVRILTIEQVILERCDEILKELRDIKKEMQR